MREPVAFAAVMLVTLAGCSGEERAGELAGSGAAGGISAAAGDGGAAAGAAGQSGGASSGPSAGAPFVGGGGAVAGGGAAVGGATAAAGATVAGGAAGSGGDGSGEGGGPGTPPACATNELARCSGTAPIVCDFGGGVGDYAVTLELGGPAESSTYVEAESNRRVLSNVTLSAGQTKRFTFAVNVRNPQGQPIQNVPPGTPGLQLYLRGAAPALREVCVEPLISKPKLWIAGDSTVCDQSDPAYAGWGQHLPQHFAAPVSVANYADSGESSSTVLGSAKLWGAIKAGWRAGDWVLVQVGHNDKDVTSSAFESNIRAFVTQAKSAGVNIVLCTPIARVGYALDDEHQSSAGANIPRIIRDVAEEYEVPLIDLTTLTWNWLQTVDWKPYFALGTDRTHTSPAGAEVVAGLVRDAIREQQLELARFLR